MKVRNGFVSNSSSTSFIIDSTNVFNVAKDMLDIIKQEWLDWDDNKVTKAKTKKQFSKYYDNIAKLKSILPEGCDGIMMPSCNYDTYIVLDKDENRCLVATCNNHHWDDLHYTSIDEGEDSLLHAVVRKSKFFDVRSGLVLNYPIYLAGKFKCPSCSAEFWEYYLTQDGKAVCGSCFKVIDIPKVK